MTKWKRALYLLSVMFLSVIMCFGVHTGQVQAVTTVKKLVLNKSNVTLTKGKTVTLRVTNNKKKVTWKSSNKSVATVNSSGKVKALKTGTAVITATIQDVKATCKIKVTEQETTKTENEAITITFDSRGGPAVAPVTIKKGQALASLPVIDRDGCRLRGWYNKLGKIIDGVYYITRDEEILIDTKTVFTEDTTIYAIWETDTMPDYEYELNASGNNSFELIIKKAQEVVIEIIEPGMSEFDKVKAVYDYIMIHTSYDHFGSREEADHSIFNASGPLLKGKAVCAGYADVFWIFMDILHMECEFVTSADGNHAWNLVKVDGEWYQVDATWDDDNEMYPLGELSYYKHFLASDEKMRAYGHVWNEEDYPKCTSTKYDNYEDQLVRERDADRLYEEYGMMEEEYWKQEEAAMAADFYSYYGISYDEFVAEYGLSYYEFIDTRGMHFSEYIDSKGRYSESPLEARVYEYLHGEMD